MTIAMVQKHSGGVASLHRPVVGLATIPRFRLVLLGLPLRPDGGALPAALFWFKRSISRPPLWQVVRVASKVFRDQAWLQTRPSSDTY